MQPKRRAASPTPPPALAPSAPAPSSHTPAAKKPKHAVIAFPVAASASPAAACGPVDDYCPMHGQSGVHVLSADVDHMLNCTDIVAGSNSNKFYRMQLLSSGSKFHMWTRWGRVGDPFRSTASALKDFDNETAARKEYAKVLRAKTETKKGYRVVDIVRVAPPQAAASANASAASASSASSSGASSSSDDKSSAVEVAPSTLEPTTAELVKTLFDMDMFKSVMVEIKVDVTKLPLGMISVAQLQHGQDLLAQLQTLLKGHNAADAETVAQLSGEFYMAVPHVFSRSQRPPPIDSLELLQEKFDMVSTLKNIQIAQQMGIDTSDATWSGSTNPLDAKYAKLNTDLSLLSRGDPMYARICAYIQNTCPGATVDGSGGQRGAAGGGGGYGYGLGFHLENIWEVRRGDEDASYKAFDAVGNRRLLWHGTNVACAAAILKTGLRIMPSVNGGRVGSGIYLADALQKSNMYVRHHRRADGTMLGMVFLVEAALGTMAEITRDDGSLVKAPDGYHSVMAKGSIAPNMSNAYAHTFDVRAKKSHASSNSSSAAADRHAPAHHSVLVPQGTLQQTGVNSLFQHNEFLVYNEAQQRIRYILTFRA